MVILHELGHIVVFILSLFPFYFFKRSSLTLKNLLVGLTAAIFIDLDHFVDFFIFYGWPKSWLYPDLMVLLKDFLSANYFELSGRVMVLLHSWELVLLVFIFYIVRPEHQKYSWLFFIAWGMCVHILFDVFYYGFDFSAYLLAFRVEQNFNISVFGH